MKATHMSGQLIRDNHTLYIKCDSATTEQITKALHQAVSKYCENYGVKISCSFKVSRIETRNGDPHGVAFVYVTNPEVYYMLLGKNPDGTDRIEYRDDPTWAPPSDDMLTNDSGWSMISPPLTGGNWCDMVEEEEQEFCMPMVCPKIAVQLPPLMALPPYELTDQQLEAKRQQIIDTNAGKEGFNPDLVTLPREAYFNVDAAICKPVEAKYMPNILKAVGVDDWVTKDDLKVLFAPFAHDHTTMHERVVKGHRSNEAYPFVNINEDRVAFIIFDPATHDAQFALHMMKKTTVRKTQADGTQLSCILMFGHSFRTDRDIMASINQKPRVISSAPRSRPANFPREVSLPIERPKSAVKATAKTAAKSASKTLSKPSVLSSENMYAILLNE